MNLAREIAAVAIPPFVAGVGAALIFQVLDRFTSLYKRKADEAR